MPLLVLLSECRGGADAQHSKSKTSSQLPSSDGLPSPEENTIPLLFQPPRLMKKSGPSMPPGGHGRLDPANPGVLGPLLLGVDEADFSPNPKSNPS